MLAAWTLVLGISVAYAKVGTGNSWTQLENGNWPENSSNPKCETGTSICVRWSTNCQNGYFEGYWHYDLVRPSYWKTAAISAIEEWSGQPFRSPVFTHTPNGCGLAATHICVSEKDAHDPTKCGVATELHYDSGIIHNAWAYANTTTIATFYDDGPNKPAPSGYTCPVHHLMLHELGHDWSEGHSALAAALMYSGGNTTEQVDSYADAELNAVYGRVAYSGSGGTGCSSTSDTSIEYCPQAVLNIKAKLLQEGRALYDQVS